MRKRIGIIILLINVCLCSCGKTGAPMVPDKPLYEKNAYETCDVSVGDITPEFTLVLQPDQVEVTSYGTTNPELELNQLNVSVGDRVSVGEVLVSFASEELENNIEEYKKQIRDNNELIEHNERLGNIQDNKHLEDKNYVLGLYLSEAEEELTSYTIRTETDGVVSYIDKQLRVGVYQPNKKLIGVTKGNGIYKAVTDNRYEFEKDREYEAYMEDICIKLQLLQVNEENGKRTITFLAGTEANVIANTSLSLKVQKDTIKDAVYVPKEAVTKVEDKEIVYVLNEQGFRHAVEVEITDQNNDYYVIGKGLKGWETVTMD